ncbi:MAG: GntR family transcriptional regulator [Chloroflexota bacterium]|nr:GntR family transcriptional regulator [Anaerolineae bacterium]HMM26764.1 GntR family transcriptional regulator [Aggregatilineaceae bacterium]
MVRFRLTRDSSLPLHRQLLNELRHAILSGELQPDDQLPGEIELVAQLGVSRATIRRAWQDALEEELIYRVTGKGTYVAGVQPARAPRQVVGFLVPGFHSPFDSYLLVGAESVLRAQGYGLLFACTERNVDEENRMVHEMCRDGVAGILLWPALGNSKQRALMDPHCNIPAVLMDRLIPGLPLPCVSSNNHRGGLQAMHHLLELGHRQIAFLASPHLDLWTIAERFRAYEDAMRSAGLEPLEPIVIGSREEFKVYAEYVSYLAAYRDEIEAVARLLAQPDRPTAIFAMNDLMAFIIIRAAALAGLSVPRDLSIVGFDNLALAEHIDPPLTTVAQDPMSIGREAARRLLALIQGEPAQDILTLLPTHLVTRESTAPIGTRAAIRKEDTDSAEKDELTRMAIGHPSSELDRAQQ